MQLSSGNPNLRALARLRAGQSSTAAGNLYVDQEVDDELNIAYEELWWDAKAVNGGWGVVRDTTLDAVADQVSYDIDTAPGDADGTILQVAIELDGRALLTDNAAVWTYLKPSMIQQAERGWREGSITTTKYYVYERRDGQENIRIFMPPAVAGTNNIQFTYEQSLTALSGATDVPILPPTFHRVIAYMAASRLRSSRNMEVPPQLQQDIALGRQRWLEHVEEPMLDLERSVISRGWNDNSFNFATRTGFYSRP